MKTLYAACAVVVLAACGPSSGNDAGTGGGGGDGQGGGAAAQGGGMAQGGGAASDVLPRADRSSAIAISADDSTIASVNPDSDSVSFFSAAQKTRVSQVQFPPGSMPVAVTIAPDNATAYVVLRKAQRLVKITGINTLAPQTQTPEAVLGSEPTGVALSPTGRVAVVPNFGETTVSFVTTDDMNAGKVELGVGGNPRAVAVTNNLDGSDADETAYVTQFYGTPVAEASDTGRIGKVFPIPLATRTVGAAISLAPIADTGFNTGALPDGGTAANVGCAPNQLFGIAIAAGKAFVTHVCASPKGPLNPVTNLFAAVSVIDLATGLEDTGPTGTVALSRLLKEQDTAGTASLLGVPVAIDFKNDRVAYVVSQAGDVVQRITYDATATPPIKLGTAGAFAQIDTRGTTGTKVAMGLVSAHASQTLYVNNWVDRSVTVVDLNNQAVDTVIRSAELPTSGTALAVHNGRKFYFTGTGRWSVRGVNSCGSCHPDGLSDNLTWVFAAGPRQTTPMDGTFSKVDHGDQRALNWTAIFDEIHDFELNTRGTAGGVGAIVSDTTPALLSRIDLAAPVSLDGGFVLTQNDFLAGSTRDTTRLKSVLKDWEEIEEFSRTIKANRAPTTLVQNDVVVGAGLFTEGKCQNCHGGPKWTVSRVSFTPSQDLNGARAVAGGVAASGLRTQALDGGLLSGLPAGAKTIDTTKVSVERLSDGGVVAPERITCVLRQVRTFDVADPVEKKADNSQAQGENGFNPPSLFGMATSAPYGHAGAFKTLDELFSSPRAQVHLTAGNANFSLDATQRRQLAAFINSIDDGTTPVAADQNGIDICGGY